MAQRYALVIGISSYHRSLGNLTKPATDAQAVAQCLRHHGGFEVTLLTETLTLEALRQALKQFLLEQANGNDALIYFTGHGILLQSTTGYRETFLAASDTEIIRQASKPMEPLYILPFGELNSLIQQSSLSSLVLLLDCCHSGNMLERDPVERALTAFNSTQRNYCFITACRSFEESRAKRSDQHSLFTGALLEALAAPTRSEDESTITSGLLFYRLSQNLKGSGQEALHLGWGNDIAIATYAAIPTDNSEPALNLANPYIGLASFDSATANYFYGREQAVRALQARLVNCRVLTVFGPSGCGKSSLIKAGLLPELRDRPFESAAWEVEMLTPTAQPLQVLGDRLTQRSQSTAPFVLFIDQFEELFTLCVEDADHRRFIQLMTTAIATMQHLKRVIIAIRGDFLDNCAKIPESATLINRESELTTYMMTHLSASEMVSAIERPAAQHGVTFERGLVPQIIADVGDEPGALPLLQYALTQLWQVCTQSKASEVLTFAGYQQIGGVQGALQQRADQLHSSFHPDDQAFVRQLFMELVQLGEGQEVTRRKASWGKLRAIAPHAQLIRVVERLTHERLIVTDEKTVEVAHEALLSEWTLLKNWIEENRDNIRLSRRLESDCHDWQEKAQSEDFLLSTGRLAAIQEWVEKEQPRLTQTETEFLNKSIEKRDREIQSQLVQERKLKEEAEGRAIAEIGEKIEAERREKEALARVKAEKRGKKFAIAAGTLGVFALGLGSLVQFRQSQIEQQQAITIATSIGKAQQLLETHNQIEALISSVETLAELREMSRENQDELQKIYEIISKVNEKNRASAYQDGIYGIGSSLNGKIVVMGGSSKSIRIWSLEKNILSTAVGNHEDVIFSTRFSPDSKNFASASLDKTAKLWTNEGKQVHSFFHGSKVFDISFNSDGQQVATAGKGQKISVWSTKKFKLIRNLIDRETLGKTDYKILGVDFHPIKKSLLITTGFEDYDIAIWDLSQKANNEPKRIDKTDSQTMSARFSRDGNKIVSCNNKGIINIRNVNGELIGKINSGEGFTYYAEFDPTSRFIASASANQTIKVWSVNDAIAEWKKNRQEFKEVYRQFESGTGSINKISFLKAENDTLLLAAASEEGVVNIWEVFKKKEQKKKEYRTTELLINGCQSLKDYVEVNPDKSEKIKKICTF